MDFRKRRPKVIALTLGGKSGRVFYIRSTLHEGMNNSSDDSDVTSSDESYPKKQRID